jgi:fucose permease
MQGGATGVAVKSPFQVIRELGLRGMYTGYSATMLRDVPFNMIFFSTSALFRKHLANEKGEVSSVGVLAASAGAGVLAAAIDTPADTIKVTTYLLLTYQHCYQYITLIDNECNNNS